MKYVEAPEAYIPRDNDGPAVFLAGGITGCPDWQSEVRAAFAHERVVLLNPRRSSFDLSDPAATQQQIPWEYNHRHHPNLALFLFWFPDSPEETVQPIALFELGGAFAGSVPLVIGAAPGYPRRTDVVLQTKCARPELTVHHTLPATITDAREQLRLHRGLPTSRLGMPQQ